MQYSHKAANHERAALQGRRTQAKRRNESERSLVKAAIDIISEEGVATATFDMIARRSGYSRGLVGQRFGSKQGLIDAVIAYLQAKQDAAASDRRIDELPGLKALLTYVDFYLKELADEREGLAYFRLLSSAVADNLALAATFAATHAVARSRLEAWVRRGQREGNVRADLDPFSTAMMTGSLLLGVSIQLLVDPSMEVAPVSAAIGSTLKSAFAAKRRRSPPEGVAPATPSTRRRPPKPRSAPPRRRAPRSS